MEDFVVSVFRNDGAGLVFLYYLETEPSRSEVVRLLLQIRGDKKCQY